MALSITSWLRFAGHAGNEAYAASIVLLVGSWSER